MLWPNWCGGSYQSASPLADNELTFNWYPEPIESPGPQIRLCLNPTPGVTSIGTGTETPGRAHIVANEREFAVIGTKFYEIDINGTRTDKGTVAINGNPATLSFNGMSGAQIMITSGGNLYIYNITSGAFSNVTGMNGKADMGDMLDGRFLVLDFETATVYFSALNDGTSWNTTTDFFRRGIAGDPWNSMKVANRYIWLWGQQTAEIWYDQGTLPLPFVPYTSSVIPWGCAASFSPCLANNVIVWLGKSKDGRSVVLASEGFSPKVVSTYAMSNVLGGYPDISDAVGDTYTEGGHTFYILNMTKANSTLCWDSDTNLWHNRGTWNPDTNQFLVWRPRFHAYAFNQHRMLDSETGTIYRMDNSLTTDVGGVNIRRLRQPAPLTQENGRIFISAFELDMEPGLGNTVDPGSDPQVMMSVSDDGGKTFGTERFRSAGKIGEYQARAIWYKLGMGRRRICRVSVTDPIQWRVMGAYVDLQAFT